MSDQRTGLDEAQRAATGDMPTSELRAALHETADLVADYLEGIEDYAVLPQVEPGELTVRLGGPPPEEPQPLAQIMRDVVAEVVPNVTHWQSPNNLAYIGSTASGIGIIGELVSTALNANAFLWRVSPVGTELEGITVDWLRQGFGLPDAFDGVYNDTASMSTLSGLACARQQATGNASQAGLKDARPLRIYTSSQAHSSIERAAMILGIGREGVRTIELDGELAMRPDALRDAIAEDRAAGWLPAGVAATIGTTGTTAIDPVADIADVTGSEGLWLHVDAAYAGSAALIPEMRGHFAGWERADSIVVNPHKWMFTPFDCSLLLTRKMDTLRDCAQPGARVPAHVRRQGRRPRLQRVRAPARPQGPRHQDVDAAPLLRPRGHPGARAGAHRPGPRAGGLDRGGPRRRSALPRALRHRLLPHAAAALCRSGKGSRRSPQAIDALNEAVMNRLNGSGRIFLSHTKIDGVFVLRLAIGNLRMERRHIERAWALLQAAARELDAEAA